MDYSGIPAQTLQDWRAQSR